MSYEFDGAHSQFTEHLDQLRRVLAFADTHGLGPRKPARDAATAEKAAVYVWLAGALEQFVRRFLVGLMQRLERESVRTSDLRPALLAVCCGARFERLQDLRRIDKWAERASLFNVTLEETPARFDPAHVPLDGRTIEPVHLEILWKVFEFPGSSIPHPRHKLALIDLSEIRNRLAHGEVNAWEYGKLKTVEDLRRMCRMIEEVVDHVYLTGIAYVDSRLFLR